MNLLNDCEVCGQSDFQIAGVAASPLGPFSIRYCYICLKMGAEPFWALKCATDTCRDVGGFAYYDVLDDCYKNIETYKIIPINLFEEYGISFIKRKDFVKWHQGQN